MKIAVHRNSTTPEGSYSFKWEQRLKQLKIGVKLLDLRAVDVITQVADCDGVMWHWYHLPDDKQVAPKILDAIELGLGIPVFPDLSTRWHFDEKVSQYYLLQALHGPMIPSQVFWEQQEAEEYVRQATYPIVSKLSVGAGSSNVFLLQNEQEAMKHIQDMFGSGVQPYDSYEYVPDRPISYPNLHSRARLASKYLLKRGVPVTTQLPHWYYTKEKNYVYFQQFMQNNNRDIRITVIGDRAFGFIRYNRDQDFRASGSGKIDYNQELIPAECFKIAHDVSQRAGFQSMAYDFLLDENGSPLIGEISYAFVSSAVHDCPGYWDRNIKYHAGQVWPEDVHVDDFLGYINSRK